MSLTKTIPAKITPSKSRERTGTHNASWMKQSFSYTAACFWPYLVYAY